MLPAWYRAGMDVKIAAQLYYSNFPQYQHQQSGDSGTVGLGALLGGGLGALTGASLSDHLPAMYHTESTSHVDPKLIQDTLGAVGAQHPGLQPYTNIAQQAVPLLPDIPTGSTHQDAYLPKIPAAITGGLIGSGLGMSAARAFKR